jgi:hypothetical protein
LDLKILDECLNATPMKVGQLGLDQLTKILAEWFSEKFESRSGLDGNVICSTIVNEGFEIILKVYGNNCRHPRDFWVLPCNNHSDWDGCF